MTPRVLKIRSNLTSILGWKKSGKRGRGAAGETPFLAAVSPDDHGHPVYMCMSKINAFTSVEIERWSFKHPHDGSCRDY